MIQLLQAGAKCLYWTNTSIRSQHIREPSLWIKGWGRGKSTRFFFGTICCISGMYTRFINALSAWRWLTFHLVRRRSHCQREICEGILSGYIYLKRIWRLRKLEVRLGQKTSGWRGTLESIHGSCLTKFLTMVGTFWNKVLIMILFQQTLGHLDFFIFQAHYFKRGSVCTLRCLFLSHKRRVIIYLASSYLNPSVEASHSALWGAGIEQCLTTSAPRDRYTCLNEQTCEQPLDFSWRVRSRDLVPFLKVRRMGWYIFLFTLGQRGL